MKLYSIAGWNEHFENSASRKVDDLRWVPVPNNHDGENFAAIMAHKDGPKIFSAWILMLQVASRASKRGVLARGNGKPHTPETLSAKTRLPADCFRIAFDFLETFTDWLAVEVVADSEPTPAQVAATPLPVADASLPVAPAQLPVAPDEVGKKGREGKEENGIEEKGEKEVPRAIQDLPDTATTKECLDFMLANHDEFQKCPARAIDTILHRYDSDRKLRAETCRTFSLHHAGQTLPSKGTLWAKLDGYLRTAFFKAGSGDNKKPDESPAWARLQMLEKIVSEFTARNPHPERWTDAQREDLKTNRAKIAELKKQVAGLDK